MSYDNYNSYGYTPAAPPPVEPPRSSGRSIGVWLVIGFLAALVLVVGCLTLCVMGGFLLEKQDAAKASASRSSQSSSVPSSAAAPVERQTLRPAGAPYSWQVPTGFVEVTAPASLRGEASHPSAAALTTSDTANVIVTNSDELKADATTLDDATLRSETDAVVKDLGHDPTTGSAVTVRGYRALRYTFRYGADEADNYFVFNGTTEIQVLCRWSDKKSEILRGCEEMLSTLTID
ncbi:hypothetical protein [Cryptosporangium sp. NPDC051539]|uniref:hypothetical protein n=1 Tax=Cryptosporangium sp. NPDC051539 TaxID=3363962 RepID=UPI0037A9AD04